MDDTAMGNVLYAGFMGTLIGGLIGALIGASIVYEPYEEQMIQAQCGRYDPATGDFQVLDVETNEFVNFPK